MIYQFSTSTWSNMDEPQKYFEPKMPDTKKTHYIFLFNALYLHMELIGSDRNQKSGCQWRVWFSQKGFLGW